MSLVFAILVGSASLLLANVSPEAVPSDRVSLIAAVDAVFDASKRNDSDAFLKVVSSDAKIEVDGQISALSVVSLADIASRCEVMGNISTGRPATSRAWAQAKLACDGTGTYSYAATFWFDEEGRILEGNVMRPLRVSG